MRRHNIYFTITICAALIWLVYFFRTLPQRLEMDPREGPAPLAVRIAGPQDFLQKIPRYSGPWAGCIVHVDWGDGKPEDHVGFAGACGKLLEHVYDNPGTYRIHAAIGGFQTPDGLSNVSARGVGVVHVK